MEWNGGSRRALPLKQPDEAPSIRMPTRWTSDEVIDNVRDIKAQAWRATRLDVLTGLENRRFLIELSQREESAASRSRIRKTLLALHAFEKNLISHAHPPKLRRTRANLVYQLDALEKQLTEATDHSGHQKQPETISLVRL